MEEFAYPKGEQKTKSCRGAKCLGVMEQGRCRLPNGLGKGRHTPAWVVLRLEAFWALEHPKLAPAPGFGYTVFLTGLVIANFYG